MERMKRADSAESARQEASPSPRNGAADWDLVQGVQLSAPFGRYEMAVEVADNQDR
jgi:homocysteine S-methyltransferase